MRMSRRCRRISSTTFRRARCLRSLRGDFAAEVEGLVARLAGALGVPAARIEVEIAKDEPKLPKLPGLELCGGSAASVNGLPFARLEDQHTVPIAFRPPPSKRAPAAPAGQPPGKPEGIASVYGPAKPEK
jgi:hypothetical protein